jgi:hypothetical protein
MAGLLAVLGGAYYYLESGGSREAAKEKKKSKLLDFAPGNVTAFTIKRPDGSCVTVNKSASGWKITDPIKAPADQSAADQVVSAGAGLSSEKDLGDVSDPAEFGLKTPVSLTFVLSGAQTKILKIGDKTPNGSGYYVMAGDAMKLSAIDGRSAESMLKSLLDLRSRKPMPFDTLATVSLEIQMGGTTLAAERVKEDKVKPEEARWRIVKPESGEADRGEVIKLLSRVAEVKAESFVEEDAADLAKYGLAKPEMTVWLVSDDGKKAGLMIGAPAPEGGRYAKTYGSSAVIRISSDIVSAVSGSAGKLKLMTFTGIDRQKIKSVRGETAQWLYTAERKKAANKEDDDEWKFIQPSGIVADNLSFAALVYQIEKAKYSKVIANPDKPSAYGLDRPSLTLTVTLDDGEKTVKTGSKAGLGGERYFATVTGRPEVFEIDKSTLDSFARPLSDLENRRFFMIRFEDVGRIVVNRLAQRFEVVRDGVEYKLISPEKKTVPQEKWRGFAWKIIDLRYDTLRQGPQGETGLEKPSLTISVYNTSGVLLDDVSVGARDQAHDIYYAKSSKRSVVRAIDSRFVKDEIVKSLESLLGADER